VSCIHASTPFPLFPLPPLFYATNKKKKKEKRKGTIGGEGERVEKKLKNTNLAEKIGVFLE